VALLKVEDFTYLLGNYGQKFMGIGRRTKKEGGKKMRKTVIVAMIAAIGLMLGGCTGAFNTAYIKKNYVKHSKVFDVEVKPEQRVGRRDIKFYVDKVKDSRERKGLMLDKKAFSYNWHHIRFALKDFQGSIKDITNRALYETGWGVAKSKDEATYVIDMDVQKILCWANLIFVNYETDAKMCIYNTKNNKLIVTGEPRYLRKVPIMDFNFTDGKYGGAIKVLRYFYTSLLNFFSSPEFIHAVSDNATSDNITTSKN